MRQRNGENRPARIFKSSRRVVQIKYLGCRILDLPVLASSQLELISDKTTGTQLQQNALKLSSCVSESSRQFNLFSTAGVECRAKVWPSGHTVDHTSSGRDRSTANRTANEVPNQHLKLWTKPLSLSHVVGKSASVFWPPVLMLFLLCVPGVKWISLVKGLISTEKLTERGCYALSPPTWNIHAFEYCIVKNKGSGCTEFRQDFWE